MTTSSATARTFKVQVETDWSANANQWRERSKTCVGTPFQQFDWLDAWYRHVGPAIGATARLVTVTDAVSGGLVMMLPMVTVQGRGGAALKFADDMLTDFNAPLLGPVDVADGAEAALWRSITTALPGHSVAEIRKMPAMICGRRNPLARLADARKSSTASNAISLPGSFDCYHASLERHTRMDLERCWRVLNREANATFEVVRDATRGLEVLDTIDRYQRNRLDELGSPFTLDQPAQAAFYRDRLAERLAEGRVILTCISAKGEIIAAQYAISDGHTAIILRLTNAGKAWSKVSPGRLIVHKTIEAFCNLGHQACDLSIGDYDYKRRFGVVRTPLVDLVTALSWRGRVASGRHWAVSKLRAYPEMDASVRRLASRIKTAVRLPSN